MQPSFDDAQGTSEPAQDASAEENQDLEPIPATLDISVLSSEYVDGNESSTAADMMEFGGLVNGPSNVHSVLIGFFSQSQLEEEVLQSSCRSVAANNPLPPGLGNQYAPFYYRLGFPVDKYTFGKTMYVTVFGVDKTNTPVAYTVVEIEVPAR